MWSGCLWPWPCADRHAAAIHRAHTGHDLVARVRQQTQHAALILGVYGLAKQLEAVIGAYGHDGVGSQHHGVLTGVLPRHGKCFAHGQVHRSRLR